MKFFSYNADRHDPQSTAQERKCRPLHRIQEARTSEGLSLRSVSRRIGVTVSKLAAQENEYTDLRLSDLYRWQQALDVPLDELMVEPKSRLQEPVRQRACLVRVAKTAATLLEKCESESTRCLAENLRNQLIELMPELEDVGPWPTYGQRRTREEYGRTALRPMPDIGYSMQNETECWRQQNRDSA